ncbi:MAG: hypothetical protein ABS61_00540 [Microbacterium sp. SCN 70-18]|nr:DNA cytosine methyltransferase [Microbacterium chocolatum]ODT12136.1 MAG: hypothetical protein ABS61_00540 [Microbacterium sp. SCN 70-18]
MLADHSTLRTPVRPPLPEDGPVLNVVDLFSGCGGLSLGLEQAATDAGCRLDITLAVDFEADATAVYTANFPDANAVTAAVESYFDGDLGAPATPTEQATAQAHPRTAILMGGPPCQGHSNLNNITRRRDPKNELYARMARAAEILHPAFVIIENVPSVRRDTDQVVQRTIEHLESLHYTVATGIVSLHDLGVAQTRRRHILLASAAPAAPAQTLLDQLLGNTVAAGRTLRWAIEDLADLADPAGYDRVPVANATNVTRMKYLLDNDEYDLPPHLRPLCHQTAHSYKSMYGRLNWELPAQTITSGFGSIGQGRYMHPDQTRALTAHEAARIQGFPDYFDFTAVTGRGALATMIGNAVPPALMRELGALLLPAVLPAAAAALAEPAPAVPAAPLAAARERELVPA